MNVENFLLGRSVRILRFNQPMGGVHLSRTVGAIKERYGFAKVPQTIDEYNETQGIHFKHGAFTVNREGGKQEIVIDDFTVYSDGVVADTRSHTDDADAFLDDVISWSTEYFQIKIPPGQKTETYYISNFEVNLGARLNEYVSLSTAITQQLASCLGRYGTKFGPFEVTGLSVNFDRKALPSLLTGYTLQRRENAPFESNLYFSSAPLKTDDHIALLQALESQDRGG